MKLICDLESIEVRDVFYVEQLYSQKHAHMLHKHTGILELLYIASGEGRYSVGNRAYAVRAGDLVVCNADVIHGEAPFQDHTIQTYCCALAGVQIEGLPGSTLLHTSHCPVIPLHGSAAEIGRIMPVLYALHSAALDENRTVCQRLGTSVLLLTIHAIEEQDSSSKSGLEQKKGRFGPSDHGIFGSSLYRNSLARGDQRIAAYQPVPSVPFVQAGDRGGAHAIYHPAPHRRSTEPAHGDQAADPHD